MTEDNLALAFKERFREFSREPALTFFRNGVPAPGLSYGQLDAGVNRCAGLLAREGVRSRDRVILLLEKSTAWVMAHLALIRMGAVVVPLNPGFKPHELAYLLKDADARLILADPEIHETVRSLVPETRVTAMPAEIPADTPAAPPPDNGTGQQHFETAPAGAAGMISPRDPALIVYTSGTTGNPKGAVLTHANLLHDARTIISAWQITRADILCHSLPLFHVHGLCFALHTALLSGAHVLMTDRFDPETVIDILTRKTPPGPSTVFMAVPTMYNRLMEKLGNRQPDFSHLRLITSGSAPLLEKDFLKIAGIFGKEPVEREGMSETGMNFSNPLDGIRKKGSIGLPLPGVAVRVVNPETGLDVPAGDIGELWLKSGAITAEYWNKERETRAAFSDGWFRTGDLGYRDEDGYYFLTDRMSHMIITGGENVSPKEIETVINGLEGINASSVVGIPDDRWGERIVALVEVAPGSGVREADIRTECRRKLHDLKCPKQVRFTDRLPRNTMGKILKEAVKTYF